MVLVLFSSSFVYLRLCHKSLMFSRKVLSSKGHRSYGQLFSYMVPLVPSAKEPSLPHFVVAVLPWVDGP